jgi:RNA polymerase sporulation-specific sigma factor
MTGFPEYDFMNENDIISLAQKGDDMAMECIMKKYSTLVRSKARAYFLIGADKDDIMQEGMIGLYKAVKDYNQNKTSSFTSFADLCVTRQIITAIKMATRQKHMPLNSYVSLNKSLFEEEDKTLFDLISKAEEGNPEDMIIGREHLEILQKKIDESLSKMESEVLKNYLKGKDYHEIAVEMGKELKAVDNALQRIKKKIYSLLIDGEEL